MFLKVTDFGTDEFRVVYEVERFEHRGFVVLVAARVSSCLLENRRIDLREPEVEYDTIRVFELEENGNLAMEITNSNEHLVVIEELGEGWDEDEEPEEEDEDEDEDPTDEQIAAIPLEEGE